MPDPPEDKPISAKLEAARADYAAYWQAVDRELYDLCRRHPGHEDFSDVYAKVAIIGRVYAAGVTRSSRSAGNREVAAAEGIRAQSGQITAGLAGLPGRQLDRATITAVIELHSRVTRDLRPYTGSRLLQSFASKYLHFHCSLVPIYDGRAEASIGKFLVWDRAYAIRREIGKPPGSLINYYNFATAFLALSEQIHEETGTWPGIKDVDHLLWRYRPPAA